MKNNTPLSEISGFRQRLSRPSFLLSSSKNSGWRGFAFYEAGLPAECDFELEFESVFINQHIGKIFLNENVHEDKFFENNSTTNIKIPGDRMRGAWRGAQRAVNLLVGLDAFERLAGRSFYPGMFRTIIGTDPVIEHLLRVLRLDARHGHPSGPMLGESVVMALLQGILKPADALSGKAEIQTSRQELARLREWIEANLSSSLSLEDMAAEIGMSVRHLSRIFHNTTGYTPYKYIVMLRVGRAKQLIQENRLTLQEIASLVGFANQSHMATTFRKVLGVSPSQIGNTAR